MSVSVVIVRGVLAEVRRRGCDADELLRAMDLDAARLSDIRETISMVQAERLVHAAVAVRPALRMCMPARFLVESTLCSAARLSARFTPGGEGLREVHVEHPAPSYAEQYREVFGCPVLFDRPRNGLLFPRAALDVPQLHADETVCAVFSEAAERLLEARTRESMSERVRTLLRWESDLANVDVARIARHIGITPRAVRRRLGAEGMPLSSLIDEARCHVACRELRRSDTTIKETAELLGFSEPSAFHRAFKRWTGRTPAEFSRSPPERDQVGPPPE